jgi:hypothetical protein
MQNSSYIAFYQILSHIHIFLDFVKFSNLECHKFLMKVIYFIIWFFATQILMIEPKYTNFVLMYLFKYFNKFENIKLI